MKTIAVLLATLVASSAAGQQRLLPSPDGNVSLKLEIQRSIDKGIAYLLTQQDVESGSFSDPQLPAFTALAAAAMLGDPSRDPEADLGGELEKALDFLVRNQKVDGGIYGKGLATYNTALSVMALSQSGRQSDYPVIARARRLLINQQQDYDRRGVSDNLFDGGVGYGGSYAHSDLSNSHLAMEALYYSQKILADTEFDESAEFDLDWEAAIEFVSRCQNSPETVERLGETVGLRKEDEGGFVYFPGNTKSDVIELDGDGERVALRSYGSMSYAGLLAFIYADMDQSDPRIQSALDWLRSHFTLEENPGMDAQGLFYYYHTMAKALNTARINRLETPQGKNINWREDLALKIMAEQASDGHWLNRGSNRWMEDNPVLVTSYSLLSLQHIFRGL